MKTNTKTPDCIVNSRTTDEYNNLVSIWGYLSNSNLGSKYIKPTALIPQITVVFPSFTKEEPSAVPIEPEKYF